MYSVYVNNEKVKSYKYEIQAITYCFLKGYVTCGRGWYFLNDKVKVVWGNE